MSKELSNIAPERRNGHLSPPSVTFEPRFDVWEGDDELVLYGDMPGVSANDLDIEFENGQLTIRRQVKPRYDSELSAQEYGTGDYHRSFAVGDSIDADNISAELESGVLTLRLPKSAKLKPRKIEVKTD